MRRIASPLLLAAFLWLPTAVAQPSDGCGSVDGWFGNASCGATNNGSSVSIGASRQVDRPSAAPDRGSRGGGGGGGFAPQETVRDPNAVYPGGRTRDEWLAQCAFDLSCAGAGEAPGGAPLPGTEQADVRPTEAEPEAQPDVTSATIDDVASFAPTPPRMVGEPDGVGVVGMPTNFLVDATEHTERGEIFDIPVTVRFTPVSYLFDYGDGATQETTSPGTTWDDLDAPQFTATETSHSYGETGEFAASVTIRYAAEADAGFGWFPIAGVLAIDAGPVTVRVVDVDTALVDRTCEEDPGGPGC